MTPEQKTGAELIAEERLRQMQKEGWTPEHDDSHVNGELVRAAQVYSMNKEQREYCNEDGECVFSVFESGFWPWDMKHWKPTPNDRVRELVKAGALIAAEIDRLKRKKS